MSREDIRVGTPLWAGGFGTVTWLGAHQVGVAFLDRGEPSIIAAVPYSGAAMMAARWEELLRDDGRIQTVVY